MNVSVLRAVTTYNRLFKPVRVFIEITTRAWALKATFKSSRRLFTWHFLIHCDGCVEVCTTGVWKCARQVCGSVHNRCVEVCTTGAWKSTRRVCGSVHDRCVEVFRTGVWKSARRVCGSVHDRCVDECTTGVWKCARHVCGRVHDGYVEVCTTGVRKIARRVCGSVHDRCTTALLCKSILQKSPISKPVRRFVRSPQPFSN